MPSGGGWAEGGKSTYQHPDRRDWWQREASPLRAEVSAGTPPRHYGNQDAAKAGRRLRQKQPQTRTPQGPRHLLVSPTPSNRGGGSGSGCDGGGGGGNSEGAEKAPRVPPVGNLGDCGAACPEPAQNLPHQNRTSKSAPLPDSSFDSSYRRVAGKPAFSAFALASGLRRTGSSRHAEAD